MVAKQLQAGLQIAILSELDRAFAAEGKVNKETAKNHQKLADALAIAIAAEVVKFLQTAVQVAPGIPTAGSAAAQVTTAPGKLI
jgi:hypothetical protein